MYIIELNALSHIVGRVEYLKQFLFVRSKVVDFKWVKSLIYRSKVFDFSFFLPKFRQKLSSIYFNENLWGVRSKDVDFNSPQNLNYRSKDFDFKFSSEV